MVPERPAPDTESTAELRLFDRLRDETPDEIVAFHSVAWLVPGKAGKPRRGESDFVLAHPDHCVVTLEVKGGSIRYDATVGEWFSTGKEGEKEIKDPVRQGERASYLLRDALARAKRGGGEALPYGNAVAFPDTTIGPRPLRPDLPREILIDHRDLSSLAGRLERLFRYWDRDESLGAAGIELLESVLANSFDLHAPLAYELEEEERQLLQLTEEQYSVLDMLSRQTRVAIGGCAGSGKTFLAAEKARRLADQGFRVLVLCFNRFLAGHLRRGLADVDEIDVYSYDGLCRAVLEESGIDFPDEPDDGGGRYWQELREAFAEAASSAERSYGALIVDEAQDFHEDWWLPLQLLLDDPDKSPLYVFFDDNQRIFAVPANLPVPGEPLRLPVNCRNTKTINRLVTQFYRGDTIEARGPEGPPIDRHFYDSDKELLAQLDENVARWLREAEIAPANIALLSAKSAARSVLWQVDELGGAKLTDDPWEKGKILRSSIHRFKGLERLVVAVTELEGARDDVFYVGFSRPNVFLSIFCPKNARHRLPREVVG
jgi:AAA ATPase domain/Nuclease-related domain